MKHEVKREAFSVTMGIRSHFWQNAVVQKPLDPKGLSIGCSESRSTMRREAFLRYRKNKSYSDQTVYYDSDAIYRNQSIYGGRIYISSRGRMCLLLSIRLLWLRDRIAIFPFG